MKIHFEHYNTFQTLPGDIHQHIGNYLGSVDRINLSSVNHDMKKLNSPYYGGQYWLSYLKEYYLEIASEETTTPKTAYQMFKQQVQVHYQLLSPNDTRLFIFARENDIESLKKWRSKPHWFTSLFGNKGYPVQFNDLYKRDSKGNSLFYWIIYTENPKLVSYCFSIAAKYYQTKRFEVNTTMLGGYTLLHLAAFSNQPLNVIQSLLDDGANINVCDKTGFTPLYMAAIQGFDKIVELLTRQPNIDVNKTLFNNNTNNGTPLFAAIQREHLKVVKVLLNHPNIEVNAESAPREMRTPLQLAVESRNINIFKRVIAHQAIKVNLAYTAYGDTPLYLACQYKQPDMVKRLMSHPDIDVNQPCTNNGYTPLCASIAQADYSTFRLLIQDPRIDINKTDKTGYAAIHLVAKDGHLRMLDMLLTRGEIKINLKTTSGKTATDLARENEHFDIVERLQLARSPKLMRNASSISYTKATLFHHTTGMKKTDTLQDISKDSSQTSNTNSLNPTGMRAF